MKMKIIFICIIVLISLVSCKNQPKQTGDGFNIVNPATADNPNPSNTNGIPAIEFNELEYNFGVVLQGEKIVHDFVFTNTGNANLIISNAKASCGCTVPRWTKEPIKPGEKGNIEVIFDSANRSGKSSKTIIVYTNAYPSTTELTIRCEIIK